MKICKFCGEQNLDSRTKCSRCSVWLEEPVISLVQENPLGANGFVLDVHENPSEAPIDITVPSETAYAVPLYLVPTWKFILYSLVTFWLYEWYWFYRMWNTVKERNALDASTFWRSFFGGLFSGELSKEIVKLLNAKEIPHKINPIFILISYITLWALVKLPDPYWLVCYFTFLPLLPLVDGMNEYGKKTEWKLPEENIRWWQVILVILGAVWLAFGVVWAFFPEEALDFPEGEKTSSATEESSGAAEM